MQVTERTYATDNETRKALYVLLDSEMNGSKEVETRLIQMKYMDGHSYEEIAAVLGGNARSLYVSAGRILLKLEQRMQVKICA